jgi:hypothetical protein
MSDQRNMLEVKRLHQPEQVRNQGLPAVIPDAGRLVAQVITALVGHDHSIPGLGQRSNLVPPSVPELREAVEQNQRRPLARPGQDRVQSYPIGFDLDMFEGRVE